MKQLKALLLALTLIATPALADCVLRQSDAVEIPLGPFVDATDGVTAETGLTISQADVRLKKCTAAGDCAAWAQVNESTSASHEENGWYEKDLNATDTDTVGILQIAVHESGALPVFMRCNVIETAIYDGIYADATTSIPANAVAISGDSTAADNLETSLDDTAGPVTWEGIVDQGTAQSATATTLVLRAAAAFANDELIGATVVITGGTTGVGQSRVITDYVLATDTATVDAWTTTPSGTITYKVFATAPSNLTTAVTNIANIATCFELDGSVYRATTNCLEQGVAATRYLRTGSATQAGSTTSFVDSAISETVDDALNNYFVRWTSGTNSGHTSRICDHAASTDGITLCEALPNAVANGVTYELYVDAESMLAATTHTGATVSASVAAGGITSSSFATSAIDAAAIAPDAITSSEVAASAWEENWATVVEDQSSTSARCALAVVLAYTGGDLTTISSNSTYQDSTGSETRITGTVTTDGNRTATITCPTF